MIDNMSIINESYLTVFFYLLSHAFLLVLKLLHELRVRVRVRVMMSNATFNNISAISWRSVLLVEETEVSGENHRPVTSHWQTLSHNVVSSTSRHELDSYSTLVVMRTDFTGGCKFNYHTIMITMTPHELRNLVKSYINNE